jgi:hypothetical protein
MLGKAGVVSKILLGGSSVSLTLKFADTTLYRPHGNSTKLATWYRQPQNDLKFFLNNFSASRKKPLRWFWVDRNSLACDYEIFYL